MSLHNGQVIAIPVLTRHIVSSSNKCENTEASLPSNCVMADALRERFPGAVNVSVGSNAADLQLPDGTYVGLRANKDMASAINAFDNSMETVWQNSRTVSEAVRQVRQLIPRTVHATVTFLDRDED